MDVYKTVICNSPKLGATKMCTNCWVDNRLWYSHRMEYYWTIIRNNYGYWHWHWTQLVFSKCWNNDTEWKKQDNGEYILYISVHIKFRKYEPHRSVRKQTGIWMGSRDGGGETKDYQGARGDAGSDRCAHYLAAVMASLAYTVAHSFQLYAFNRCRLLCSSYTSINLFLFK